MHAPPWSTVLSERRQMTSDTSINPILPQMTQGKANLPFNTGAPSVFTSDRNANKQRNIRSCCDGMAEKIVVNPTSYCVFLPVHISCNKSLWFERGEKGRRVRKEGWDSSSAAVGRVCMLCSWRINTGGAAEVKTAASRERKTRSSLSESSSQLCNLIT